ncbi:hypothetical protein [Ensifer sp.]|uniref:hypothetical protein n=1 Tax=Ensifer sp. TaxID=1872086 RepID=UPI00289C9E7B|nr:hypothetical protein [Ensifer sp.]
MCRLLITGAAGQLGQVVRTRPAPLTEIIHLDDRVPVDNPGEGEKRMACCGRSDAAAVRAMVSGCDGAVEPVPHGDFTSMIEAIFHAQTLGCPVIWGGAGNDAGWWDIRISAGLSGRRATMPKHITPLTPKPDPHDPMVGLEGGSFVDNPIFKE